MFFELRTKPMSEIVFVLNPSRAAAMLNIFFFSDVREPFYVTSNILFESVNNCPVCACSSKIQLLRTLFRPHQTGH